MKRTILRSIILWMSCGTVLIHAIQIYDRMDDIEALKRHEGELTLNHPRSGKGLNQDNVKLALSVQNPDDVIRIIEPPQHFQELKRRHRQQQQQQQQQQHQQIVMQKPVNIRLSQRKPSLAKSPLLQQMPVMKVKEHIHMPMAMAMAIPMPAPAPAPSKVVKPEMNERLLRNNRRKPSISALKSLELDAHDLLTQETRLYASENQLLPQEAKFPLEILASIRQTEQQRQMQHQHQHQYQQHPLAKQRVKMQKTHTVIMEHGYEQTRFKHGQENRAGGGDGGGEYQPRRAQRQRRDVTVTLTTAPNLDIINHAQQVASLNIEQGSRLLARLDALIKHATHYLPDDNDTATHNSVLDELRKRFQSEFEPQQLIGEIEPTTTIRTIFPQRELYEILESSLNATDTIMQELIQKSVANRRDAARVTKRCSRAAQHYENTPLQQLQSRIDCMRHQLQTLRESTSSSKATASTSTTSSSTTTATIATTTTKRPTNPTIRGNKRFGLRTRRKKTTTQANQSNKNHLHSNTRIRAKDQQETPTNNQDTSVRIKAYPKAGRQHSTLATHEPLKRSSYSLSPGNVTTAAAVLLYDDVMTNIRNMLEAKNLKLSQVLHNEARKRNVDEEVAPGIGIDFIEAPASSSPSPSTHSIDDANDDLSYFRDLSRYLSDLQQIVTQLPPSHETKTQTSSGSSGSSSSGSSSSGTTGSHADWYLINDEGKILETPFDIQLQPTAVIFHRFPDIPNAAIYVHNHSNSTATTDGLEEQW